MMRLSPDPQHQEELNSQGHVPEYQEELNSPDDVPEYQELNSPDDVLKYQDLIFWRIVRILGDRYSDLVDDAIQETNLRTIEWLNKGGTIQYPKAWLSTVARNAARNMIRRESKQPETYENTEIELLPGVRDNSELFPFLWALFSLLTPIQVEIFVCVIDGKRKKDIAKQLGIKPPMVSYHLQCVKGAIRLLDDPDPDPNRPGSATKERKVGTTMDAMTKAWELITKLNGPRLTAPQLTEFKSLLLELPAFREVNGLPPRPDIRNARDILRIVQSALNVEDEERATEKTPEPGPVTEALRYLFTSDTAERRPVLNADSIAREILRIVDNFENEERATEKTPEPSVGLAYRAPGDVCTFDDGDNDDRASVWDRGSGGDERRERRPVLLVGIGEDPDEIPEWRAGLFKLPGGRIGKTTLLSHLYIGRNEKEDSGIGRGKLQNDPKQDERMSRRFVEAVVRDRGSGAGVELFKRLAELWEPEARGSGRLAELGAEVLHFSAHGTDQFVKRLGDEPVFLGLGGLVPARDRGSGVSIGDGKEAGVTRSASTSAGPAYGDNDGSASARDRIGDVRRPFGGYTDFYALARVDDSGDMIVDGGMGSGKTTGFRDGRRMHSADIDSSATARDRDAQYLILITGEPARKKSSAKSRRQAGKPEKAGELIPVDTDKVDAAVRYINERTIQSGIELAREVGDYVLETFFDGDFASFTNPSRSKSTSFRALLERQDLLLGHAPIYGFGRVSHQLKTLPAEVVSRLTLIQHRALLPLPDPDRKEAMARRALDEGWSAEELEARVSVVTIIDTIVVTIIDMVGGRSRRRRDWLEKKRVESCPELFIGEVVGVESVGDRGNGQVGMSGHALADARRGFFAGGVAVYHDDEPRGGE
ncbi:MAG: sigma-70 family RNA polymerase sigma factor [bacterium]|nr:sigma-70 family RNA polymerase sigma factor [bacterium]